MYWHSRTALVAVASAVSLLGGCDREAKQASAPPPAEVAVATVQPRTIVLTTELPGRASSFLVAEIRPQISGLVQKRLFTEGSDVKEGQVLYEIDPAPFQAALDSADANLLAAKKGLERAQSALAVSQANVARQEATLALARTTRQRYEDLLKDKAVSASERDQAVTDADVAAASLKSVEAQVASDRSAIAAAEAAIKQAEAAVQTAKINLGYTRITAPISGRIGRSTVTQGAIVTAYQPAAMATIQQLDPVYVDVPQATTALNRLRRVVEAGRLRAGNSEVDNVKLVMEDGVACAQKGTLKFRDVTVDPTTGSVILRIVAPNPDAMLLPGMFVRALVEEGVDDKAILVSQQAVSRDSKGTPLALVVDAQNKVQQRQITVDRAIGGEWLVTSGLADGDRVIMEGSQRVRPGAVVKPIPFVTAGKKPATSQPAASVAAKTN